MKKRYTIIFTVTLLILGALFLTYIQNIPHEHEYITYAKTNLRAHFDIGAGAHIQIEKNGIMSIDGRVVDINTLNTIFKRLFDLYGKDTGCVYLHLDGNATISQLKPVIKEILSVDGTCIRLVTVQGESTSDFYYFTLEIEENNFKAKNVLELSGKGIVLNNTKSDLNKLDKFPLDGNKKIICSENVLYQDLINVFSICRGNIEFIIKENANKKNTKNGILKPNIDFNER